VNTINLKVPGISCGHCVHTIQTELLELDGVRAVEANQESKTVTVAYEPPADQSKIEALLTEINYPAEKLVSL
jgi:copper chaperone